MKKQLLIGVALFSAISAFSQSAQIKKARPAGIINMQERLAKKYAIINNPHESVPNSASKASPSPNTEVAAIEQSSNTSLLAAPTPTWKAIAGTMNIYGMLVSQSKPLNYNFHAQAISLVHRTGNTYNVAGTIATAKSGNILAHITSDWGLTWDSTAIWSNNSNWARYPQGGIRPDLLSPSDLSKAYVVGMGPITSPVTNNGWIGNWYASKRLGQGNYDAVPSSTPGAQQPILNTPPFAANLAKHDFSRCYFTSTSDGAVRSIAERFMSKTATGQPTVFVGAAIIKGTFNAGVFNWTSDTIIPTVVMQSNNSPQVWGQPLMAWNDAGTTGYVIFIGAVPGATLNNQGWQPIVYKTTNSGLSWTPVTGIDFNSPAMSPVIDHIFSINTNSAITIPFFNIVEGYDATVDAAGKLHLAFTVIGTSSQHPDSLGFTYQFDANEKYQYRHTPGLRPYIYDFVGDGAGPWSVITVDSMSSEGPAGDQAGNGYADNPWDADPANQNSKVGVDSRLQMSRTPNGDFIMYSWTDSDTAFTPAAKKWNSIPNIKVRLLNTANSSLSTTTINVTRPTGAPSNPKVASQAFFHYMSPTFALEGCTGSGATTSVTAKVPFTVSNSSPLSQLTENRIWYSSASLGFIMPSFVCTGVQQHLAYNVNSIEIYPNPATSNAILSLDLKEEGSVVVNIYNTIGALAKTINTKGQLGENKMNIDLNNLSSGIYMVNVKIGNTTSTKKLIIQ